MLPKWYSITRECLSLFTKTVVTAPSRRGGSRCCINYRFSLRAINSKCPYRDLANEVKIRAPPLMQPHTGAFWSCNKTVTFAR